MRERLPLVTNVRSERVRGLVSLGRRSFRSRKELTRVEGPQAARELARFFPEKVVDAYFSQTAVERHRELFEEISGTTEHIYLLTDEIGEVVGEEAQGIFLVASLPLQGCSLVEAIESGPVVVLPQTQDPGNAGTIIRNADAFGASAVVGCAGTVDLLAPKVIRASAGSVFHLPVILDQSFLEVTEELRQHGCTILGASGGHQSVEVGMAEIDWASPHAWVFGNEARGLSGEEKSLCDRLIRIPMSGHAESLNVATASGISLFLSQEARNKREN